MGESKGQISSDEILSDVSDSDNEISSFSDYQEMIFEELAGVDPPMELNRLRRGGTVTSVELGKYLLKYRKKMRKKMRDILNRLRKNASQDYKKTLIRSVMSYNLSLTEGEIKLKIKEAKRRRNRQDRERQRNFRQTMNQQPAPTPAARGLASLAGETPTPPLHRVNGVQGLLQRLNISLEREEDPLAVHLELMTHVFATTMTGGILAIPGVGTFIEWIESDRYEYEPNLPRFSEYEPHKFFYKAYKSFTKGIAQLLYGLPKNFVLDGWLLIKSILTFDIRNVVSSLANFVKDVFYMALICGVTGFILKSSLSVVALLDSFFGTDHSTELQMIIDQYIDFAVSSIVDVLTFIPRMITYFSGGVLDPEGPITTRTVHFAQNVTSARSIITSNRRIFNFVTFILDMLRSGVQGIFSFGSTVIDSSKWFYENIMSIMQGFSQFSVKLINKLATFADNLVSYRETNGDFGATDFATLIYKQFMLKIRTAAARASVGSSSGLPHFALDLGKNVMKSIIYWLSTAFNSFQTTFFNGFNQWVMENDAMREVLQEEMAGNMYSPKSYTALHVCGMLGISKEVFDSLQNQKMVKYVNENSLNNLEVAHVIYHTKKELDLRKCQAPLLVQGPKLRF